MAAVVRKIASAGSFLLEPVMGSPEEAFESLAQTVSLEKPGGVYAAFGTWNERRVIRLSDHYDRLEDSARRLGIAVTLDRDLIGRELCAIMDEVGFAGARIRLSVAPGDPQDTLLAALASFSGVDPDLRARGVSCTLQSGGARSNPRAKQTSWLSERSSFYRDAYEALLLNDDNCILEGASTNFYAITRHTDGSALLVTAEEGILHGIARSIVLEVAPAITHVELRALHARELDSIEECFITSASRGVVPVVRIDGNSVGQGKPGPVTSELAVRYEERARVLEEPICPDP